MSNVLKRFFHRQAVADTAREGEPNHHERIEPAVTLGPQTLRPANDATPLKMANDPAPVEPARDPAPAMMTSDEEIVEQQITALIAVWDKTSLRARRKFLTRIDQRILSAHLMRSASRNAPDTAAVLGPSGAVAAATPAPAVSF
jgi:hypothetical protein